LVTNSFLLKIIKTNKTKQRKCSDLENILKTLETGLAEREAMIRILQSNKTMSNSNLAAEYVNKAASGVIVGVPATSRVLGGTNSVDTTSSLRSMLPILNQTQSSLHMPNHNIPQHHYQMSLVGTPSSSSTAILHNKTFSHLGGESRPNMYTSNPSFSSGALLLPAPPPPPAPLSSVATSISMLSPAMHHSKQLSTPITIPSSNTFKSISLNSTPIRNMGAFSATQPQSHSFLQQIHNVNQPQSNPLLLGRSMTPSADMLLLRSSATPIGGHTTSDIYRSMTPGPSDLHRPHALTSFGGLTNQLDQLTLKTAALRRESAPAGVFVANSSSHPGVSIGSHSGNK
jgi:hypothetical protein